MYGMDLTPFEERLFISCGTSVKIKRFKRSAIMTSGMFALLFCALSFTMQITWLIGIVLAVFSLFNLAEIRRFAAIIAAYRSLISKLTDGKITGDPAIETSLARNAMLLTMFYIALLAALFLIDPPFTSPASGMATVFFILLMLRLKLVAANCIEASKTEAFEEGKKRQARFTENG